VAGVHNAYNSLAALAVGHQLGFPVDAAIEGIGSFLGVRRRFELVGASDGVRVIDDYAHHPTEVKAVLRALHEAGKYVRVIFQPHRYSRTKNLYREFAHAFDDADEVVLTDIYSAGEPNPDGVNVELVYQEVLKTGHKHVSVVRKEQILPFLAEHPLKDGVMIFMGAGDIGEIASEFVSHLDACAST
jgi:UDP-N-acetylmuramate--alanine ligase